ncbi:hypothetical protein FKW77_001010 [Venturia effusa]|uniref:Uncharacterized protein n=1 Tax=Venturia effusa TaxID=50376 RepID=A0A517L6L3_9PEZI|nr:hypothetical protein FKW77_001010 [Venturia effusa]
MLHLTETTRATILSLYRRHTIRNVRAILAILSIHNPSLAAYPHNDDSSNYETEHMEDWLSPVQYRKVVAAAGLTRKVRDRVPSDKEKIIEMLQQARCRDYIDEALTREEVKMLRNMGVQTLGNFEGRGSAVGFGEKDLDTQTEESGLRTPMFDE